MNKTAIEWTDFSANPIKYRDPSGKIVWGCVKTSPGCAHCYSEAIAERFNRGGPFTAKAMAGLTPFIDEQELRRMLNYKPASGKRCFVGDMTDVFGEWVPDGLLDRMFAAFALRPDVTFQVLTKRAERMMQYASGDNLHQRIHEAIKHRMGYGHPERPAINRRDVPLPNVWLGLSCEDQQRADERIPLLLNTPAAVHFVSCEPLLGSIVFGDVVMPDGDHLNALFNDGTSTGLDWVIVGGESGTGSRPCNVAWIRSIAEQCKAASVPCFVKQLGSKPIDEQYFREASRWFEKEWGFRPGLPNQIEECTFRIKDKKGGDIDEFPSDLRVRQFPAVEDSRAGLFGEVT